MDETETRPTRPHLIVPTDERLRLCRRILLNRLWARAMEGDNQAAATYLRDIDTNGSELTRNDVNELTDTELIAECKRVGIHITMEPPNAPETTNTKTANPPTDHPRTPKKNETH